MFLRELFLPRAKAGFSGSFEPYQSGSGGIQNIVAACSGPVERKPIRR
jgi:hypothetical protein